MNVSWKKYMKVGLVQFMAFPQTLKGKDLSGKPGKGSYRRFL